MMIMNGLFRGVMVDFKVQYLTVGITGNPEKPYLTQPTFEPATSLKQRSMES
jgi:hypothetical protein